MFSSGLVPGGAAERAGQVRVDDVLTEIDGVDIRSAAIESVKHMIVGAPGSTLRLLVLRNSPQGPSPISIVLKRSKPVATTNALPPLQQPQPQQPQSTAGRDLLSQSQSRASFNLAPSRSDNEPSSLYGTRMSVSGDATQCGVGLSLIPRSDGTIAVKAIAAGSSAQLSGRIQVGDLLLAVEEQPVKGMDIVDLRPLIVGAHETQVNMTFRDASSRQPAFTLTLKRFTSRPISRSSSPHPASRRRPEISLCPSPPPGTSASRVTSMPSSPSRSVQSMSRPGETTASSEAIGIGAFLMPDSTTGGYLVKSLAGDGAAARSGQIFVGDIVTHVDGCALRQLSLPQVRDLIRGPPEKCVAASRRVLL
jgi:C-terminal processing protease CtpA/Prc